MTESLLDSALSSMADVSTLRISLNAELIEGERKIFLFNNLVRYLDNQNQSVYLDSSDITLVVDRFDIAVTYVEKSLRLLGLNRMLERQIEVILSGHIQDHRHHQAGRSFSYFKVWNDQISSDRIVNVENSPYNLFRGRLVKAIRWTVYLEPAVVIIAVASLVYVFFSVRY